MRKNQKYSKEEMSLGIELWQESGLSQVKFCSGENLSVKTFSCWLRKYRKEKGLSVGHNPIASKTFFPVEVSGGRILNRTNPDYSRIELALPNGVQLSCPVGTDISQLKNLINF